jgi:2,4-dienoyl-CoA reductase-like NADH-dependent reductase (Old Yellow Enzyme family)
MSALFSPVALGPVTLANRVIVSPMCQYMAVDGTASDWHLAHLGQLAMGGAGLLFVEATHVTRQGRISQGCMGLYSDENEAALTRIVDWVRAHAPVTRIGIQIGHAGRKASTQRPWKGGAALTAADAPDTPWQTVAPSAVPFTEGWHTPTTLDESGLLETKAAFVAAAERAYRCGFDVLELHGAHGYLLHQFLSPLSNRRTDRYGGTPENRRRYPLEVFEAVRAAWPAERSLGIRLSATDWVEGGWTPEETVALVRALKERGCDFADISSGGSAAAAKIPLAPGYQVPFAEQVRRETGITTTAVGLIIDPHQAERIVAQGQADAVMLARGFLLDPRWAWNAARALGAEPPTLPQPYWRAPAVLPFMAKPLAQAAE